MKILILISLLTMGCGATFQELTAHVPEINGPMKARTEAITFNGTALMCVQYTAKGNSWPREWHCINRKTRKVAYVLSTKVK